MRRRRASFFSHRRSGSHDGGVRRGGRSEITAGDYIQQNRKVMSVQTSRERRRVFERRAGRVGPRHAVSESRASAGSPTRSRGCGAARRSRSMIPTPPYGAAHADRHRGRRRRRRTHRGAPVRAGHDVAVVARGKMLDAVRDHGLRIDSPLGTFTARVEAGRRAERHRAGRCAARCGEDMAGPRGGGDARSRSSDTGGIVVPLQNGVDAADQCADALGADRVFGGICHVLSWIAEPGAIKHVSAPPRVTLGAWRSPVTRASSKRSGRRSTAPASLRASRETFRPLSGTSSSSSPDSAASGRSRGRTRQPSGRSRRRGRCSSLRSTRSTPWPPPRGSRSSRTRGQGARAHRRAARRRDRVAPARHRRRAPSELDSLSGAVARIGAELARAGPDPRRRSTPRSFRRSSRPEPGADDDYLTVVLRRVARLRHGAAHAVAHQVCWHVIRAVRRFRGRRRRPAARRNLRSRRRARSVLQTLDARVECLVGADAHGIGVASQARHAAVGALADVARAAAIDRSCSSASRRHRAPVRAAGRRTVPRVARRGPGSSRSTPHDSCEAPTRGSKAAQPASDARTSRRGAKGRWRSLMRTSEAPHRTEVEAQLRLAPDRVGVAELPELDGSLEPEVSLEREGQSERLADDRRPVGQRALGRTPLGCPRVRCSRCRSCTSRRPFRGSRGPP